MIHSNDAYSAGADEQPLIRRKSPTAGTVQVSYARLPATGKYTTAATSTLIDTTQRAHGCRTACEGF